MTFLSDTWLVFVYCARITLRNPMWMVLGLFFPLVYLALFWPLFDGLAAAPGLRAGGTIAFFIPGLLVMLGLYGSTYVGFGLIADLRLGVLERLIVTPASRLALLFGRVLRDASVLVVQALLLLLVAAILGLRATFLGIGLSLVLMVLIGVLMASFSYAVALRLREENALAAALNSLTMPLVLLSGILLPLTLAPAWLRTLAVADPFAYFVDAARALFIGDVTDSAVVRGYVMVTSLALLTLLWASRSYRRVAA